MGRKILVPCLDVMMIAFYREIQRKDHISNTKLEKDDHYYIQTRCKDLFSHYNLILRKLSEKMSRKAPENTNKMCSCLLGINTPQIEFIQYGRRIAKKVYCRLIHR